MTRSEKQKEELRRTATEKISGQDGVRLADEETTGENDFKFKRNPDACAVVVDLGSRKGWVQISGGQTNTVMISTGPERTGYQYASIPENQTCMLYGCPTVLFIHPKT